MKTNIDKTVTLTENEFKALKSKLGDQSMQIAELDYALRESGEDCWAKDKRIAELEDQIKSSNLKDLQEENLKLKSLIADLRGTLRTLSNKLYI
jgi:septal ring factor EnvC (AmiA/AmiB activator)